MSLFTIRFIRVDEEIWTSFPTNRPLALLADDAVGIERRIRKGVNVLQERRRYSLICDQIETLALVAWWHHSKIRKPETLRGRAADLYVRLVEAMHEMSARDGDEWLSEIGRSFFLIGSPSGANEASLERQRMLFQRVSESWVRHQANSFLRPEEAATIERIAQVKVDLLKTAERDRQAVVEVITLAWEDR